MDQFNIIAGIITIVSFIFAIVIYFTDKSFKQHMESGLIGLINSLDKMAAMKEEKHITKKEMGIVAESARDHAISLLKSFSDKEERFRTFSFGINEKNIENVIEERKKANGLSYGGCILSGQDVAVAPDSTLDIGKVCVDGPLITYDENAHKITRGVVEAILEHETSNYLLINDELALTANHKVKCRDRGWISVDRLTIGDEILRIDLQWKLVRSISLIQKSSKVFDITASDGNLFVNGYLIHNKQV